MDARQLKKCSRVQLLELLLEVTEENDRLKAENTRLQAELDSRRLICMESGSLAEAALRLAGVFEAADEAARIFQENLQRRPDDGPAEC